MSEKNASEPTNASLTHTRSGRALFDAFGGGVHGIVVGDVDRDPDRLTAGPLNVSDRPVDSGLSAGEHRDVIPVPGELPHRRATDPGASAGDHRYLPST